MNSSLAKLATAATLALALSGLVMAQKPSPFSSSYVQDPQADNTRRNKMGGTTADQQGQSKADLDMTKKIRSAITDDKSLSTMAKNVKIVTKDGMVTLRGPVKTEDEKAAINAKAVDAAGQSNVSNRITVKSN